MELLTYYGIDFAKEMGISKSRISPLNVVSQINHIACSLPQKSIHTTSCRGILANKDLSKIKYHGKVVTQEMVEEMGKLCQNDPRITRKQILSHLQMKFSNLRDVNLQNLSNIINKFGLLPKRGSVVKVDNEMIESIDEYRKQNPNASGNTIRSHLMAIFPHKPVISVPCINSLIRKHNLGTLRGVSELADAERVAMIRQLMKQRRGISVEQLESALIEAFPERVALGAAKISDLTRLNSWQKLGRVSNVKIDEEMEEMIRDLIRNDPGITLSNINKQMQTKLSNKPRVADITICRIISRLQLRADRNKIDEEMTSALVDIVRSDSALSVGKVNARLQEMFPNKPRVTDHTICLIISRLQLRAGRNKIDEEMTSAVVDIVRSDPALSAGKVNARLQEMFPNKPRVADITICRIISRLQLREGRNKIDDEISSSN